MGRLNRKWVVVARTTGDFSEDAFKVVEEELPPLGPNELRIKVIMVSCDPTQIGWSRLDTYMPKVPLNDVMRSGGVGVVEETNNDSYAVGDRVAGLLGFQMYWQGAPGEGLGAINKLPSSAPPEDALYILGYMGLTAYKFVTIGEPKEGETVIVTGAAGAVGLVVCQLAKILGCRVVATAGSEKKIAFLRDTIGVDVAINYKQEGLEQALKEACPEGVDVYWENVGGKTTEAAWPLLNRFGRVVVCGMISTYTEDNWGAGSGLPFYNTQILSKELKIQGFIVSAGPDAASILGKLGEYMATGELKSYVDKVEGFENTISALAGIFKGDNLGKRVVVYAEPDDVPKSS